MVKMLIMVNKVECDRSWESSNCTLKNYVYNIINSKKVSKKCMIRCVIIK